MAGMQQIGRALDQAIRGRQSLAELQEAAALHAPVGKIGCEIIQRLFLTIAACEHNPHPPRYVGAGIFVGEVCGPLVVERDQADIADGLSRARQEDIQQRQGAADRSGLQVGLHLLGNEKTETQDRTERLLDVVKVGPDTAARHFRQIRHLPDRLERAQHIGHSLRVKRVRIEEVGAAEHVEHGRPRRGQIGVRPGSDFRKLALLQLPERAIEEFGVPLPRRLIRQRRQRRIRRWRHPGQETRGIVRGHGVGRARERRGCEQYGRSHGRHFDGLMHRYSGLAGAIAEPGSARLRKMA